MGNRFYIKATAVLKDVESESSFCTTAYAREAESKPKMDAAQITGAASSYAGKYALNSLFLLDDSKDADTDEYKRNEVITEKEAKRLYDLMQKKRNDGSPDQRMGKSKRFKITVSDDTTTICRSHEGIRTEIAWI